MAKKKAKTKTTVYDSAEFLDSREAINAYMEEALETDDQPPSMQLSDLTSPM